MRLRVALTASGATLAFACGLFVVSAQAGKPRSSGIPSTGGPGGVSLNGGLPHALVIPGAEDLLSGALASAAERAHYLNPQAVEAREASQTAYTHLGASRANNLAREAFPAIVNDPAGGTPRLPAGQRIERYLSANAAQVTLPNGQQGFVESLQPIARRSGRSSYTPIELALRAGGDGYVPESADVAVQIPQRISAGVQTPGNGVSLTPVDAHGGALSGSGAVQGAAVLYANTQADTDTLAKPTTTGFQLDALLCSADSPQQLFYRVGMPAGARLVREGGSGIVRVVRGGLTVASVLPPVAVDSEGNGVPASMSVRGDTISVNVAHRSGSYRYPIDVDPEVTDKELYEKHEVGGGGNWEYHAEPSAAFVKYGSGSLGIRAGGEYKATNWAAWAYETKGVSKIYEAKAIASGEDTGGKIETYLELAYNAEAGKNPKPTEEKRAEIANELKEPKYANKPVQVCSAEGCPTTGGKEKNAVLFEEAATGTGKSFAGEMTEGTVYIAEPSGTHSTTELSSTPSEIEVEVEKEGKKEKVFRKNVIASGGWLSKYLGALELVAKDKGIGVADTKLEYESSPGKWELTSGAAEHNYRSEKDCQGVQCYTEHKEWWLLESKLPNGEDKIRYRAEEAMAGTESPETEGAATVKVDTAKPTGLYLEGLPWGSELSETNYEITAKATDGEGSTVASSGVESLELYVDGVSLKKVNIEEPSDTCSVAIGECTASAKYSIKGPELGAGHHQIVIVAKDRAGNEAREYEPISIRHSTPVAFGPGSVDLQSGDFALGAGDVGMGAGLTVSRNYSSRATEAGIEGPLGPEWKMDLGASESLVEMVDGSMMLTDAKGQQSIFALIEPKTEPATYEAPVGDSNLKLTLVENKTTKIREAFYLENTALHTKDKFTLPEGGTKVWVPTVQEGTVATNTVSYKYRTAEQHNEYSLPSGSKPYSIAAGPEGNQWFTDLGTNRIGKITSTGTVTEYTLPTGSQPYEIATGPEGNLWFTDRGNDKVGKITNAGVVTEYKIGQGDEPQSLVLGPNGNLWFTAHISGTQQTDIGQITPSGSVAGEYALLLGEQSVTRLTAGPDGDVWTTWGSEGLGEWQCGIEKVSMSGVVTGYALNSKTCAESITAGPKNENNLWVVEKQHVGTFNPGKIVKITTTNAVVAEYGVPGEYPNDLREGPDGNIWFTVQGSSSPQVASKVGKITPGGTVTEYPLPTESEPQETVSGSDGKLWIALYKNDAITTVTTAGVTTEPTEIRAPVPAGVKCEWTKTPTEMASGCRALEFKYAEETTAKGEGATEWNKYRGRLEKVLLVTYNPASKKMEEPAIAEYSYDKLGRLRAEWDPRVKPNSLKVTYGYDEYGHVTALTAPGQESWALTYGAIAGDAGTGRLLKAAQAPASAGLWGGTLPSNTEAPKISGSPVYGVRMATSNGAWSGSPVAYSYQWEGCTSSGECAPIAGATNPNYTPVSSDVGHTLAVQVTATNGGGSVTATSAASAVVVASTTSFTQSIDSGNSVNAVTCIPNTTDCVASDSKGNAFYATNVSWTGSATWKSWTGPGTSPSEAIDCPSSTVCLLADGSKEGFGGIMYYATSLGGTWTQAFNPTYGVDAISCPSSSFCVDGQDNRGYFRFSTNPASTIWGTQSQGSASMRGVFCLSSSFCAIADGVGSVHVATSETQVKSSSWTSTNVDGTTALNGVACTTTTSCVAVDGVGNVLNLAIASKGEASATKHNIDGTNSLTAIICTGSTTCVTVDNKGNVFVSTNSGETWTKKYVLGDDLTSVSCASSSLCAVVDTTGNVTALNPTHSSGTEGELRSPQPGSTIEYGVPLEGSGAPAQMGKNESTHMNETAKWGQADNPVEATSIIPPDSPQGWPAASYKRAVTYYLDSEGRMVNVATPTKSSYGAVSTTEYNEFNDVTRTLSPGNRERALKAGCESEEKCKSAEESKLLDTENTYNGEGAKEGEVAEPGTQLIETLGPEHMVKYTRGEKQYEPGEKAKEIMGRSYTHNYYNEGAPAENPRTHQKETYNLLTKSENFVEGPSNEKIREDVKTTITSYSGQNDLGWLLRSPTSVTTNPNSLNLTATTVYEENAAKESNGQVVETRGAGAEGSFTYVSKFGETGTEAGKLKSPFGMAIDVKGNLWVVDEGNNRIEEFGPEGKYLSKFGEEGTGNGQLKSPKAIAIDSKENFWVDDMGNNRIEEFNKEGKYSLKFGEAGAGNGQLKEPKGFAIDKEGHIWVADTGNNRVQEFDAEGKYVKQFGSEGTEVGKFKEPTSAAVDSKGNIWVVDRGNARVQEFSSEGADPALAHFGVYGAAAGQFKSPFGIAIDKESHIWVADMNNSRVQELANSGAFIAQFGWKGSEPGQLGEPRGLAIDASGNVWVADTSNNRLEEFSKGPNAHDSRLVLYSSAENTEGFTGCGKHPEWEGLPCKTLPVKQPELGGLPRLPETTTTYNMYDEPEAVEEVFTTVSGLKTTRTKKNTYDEAGRLTGSETTSSTGEDKTLPALGNKYNEATGLLETQSATIKGEVKTITSKYNTLGQLTEYVDANGNVVKYRYAGPEGDGLLEEMTDGSAEAQGKQTYAYDETTKAMTELNDSAAGVFTATYDVEGKLQNETYPNGMCANYAYNQVGEATRVEYIKTANCSEEKPTVWYYNERMSAIRGEMMSQTSSLAGDSYGYDQSGRLTEVLETPAGEGCNTRLYAYDEASNRISLTSAKPNIKGECSTEGATVQAHNYDEAGRLTDEGVAYDAFGNVTKLPAADAEGHALTSTFYVTNAVASQEQENAAKELIKNEYELDPLGRALQTTTGTTKVISHYDGAGGTVAWTCTAPSGSETCEVGKWTRNIPGIDGTLAAVQTNGGTPVLQLHDLQGDVVATAALSPSETKLLSTYNSTEFGVPNKEKAPPTFAWLGAGGVSSSLSSGVITYGATSYVPQTGMPLQSEQVEPVGEGGSGAGNPYSSTIEPWVWGAASASAAEAPGREAGRQQEAAEVAAEKCIQSGACVGADPSWVWYMDRKTALWLEAGLGAASSVAGLLKIFTSIKNLAVSGIVDLLKLFASGVSWVVKVVNGESKIIKWAKDWSINLGRCATAIWIGTYNHSTRNPTCRSEIFYKNYGPMYMGMSPLGFAVMGYVPVPEFGNDVDVSFCKYGDAWCILKGG